MKTSYLLGTPARLETRVSNCQENRLPIPNTPFKTKASRPPQFSSSKRPRLRNSRARERTTINQPGESDVKKLNRNTKGQESELRQCYVYEIRIDGVVRYIGKGRNGRIYSHLIDAKRTASRPDVKIRNLSPHFRKMLVSAVRRGLIIAENMVASNLTDGEAYKIEQEMIGNYHKQYAGQLWNTIDERFMDPKYFPKKWSNPVNPLYRVSRPLKELLDRSLSPPSAHRLSPPPTEMVERSTRKTVVFHQPCGDGVAQNSRSTPSAAPIGASWPQLQGKSTRPRNKQ